MAFFSVFECTHYLPFTFQLPNVTVDEDGTVSCDLTGFVGGAITATTLGATGAVTFDDTLDVAGATSLGDTLDVAGLTTLDDLDVGGDTSLTGDLDVAGTVRLPVASPLNGYSLQVYVSDIISANAKVAYVVIPEGGAGSIHQIAGVADATTATGSVTFTGAIGATPITTGVLTINSGVAAGTAATPVAPSAANVVAAGNVVKFTVGGTQTVAGTAMLTLTIRRTIPA